MIKPCFVIDPIHQINLIKDCVLDTNHKNEWEFTYTDKDNTKWLKYYPNSEQQGGGISVIKRMDLPKTIVELANAVKESNLEDDYIGLGIEFSNCNYSFEQIYECIMHFSDEAKRLFLKKYILIYNSDMHGIHYERVKERWKRHKINEEKLIKLKEKLFKR